MTSREFGSYTVMPCLDPVELQLRLQSHSRLPWLMRRHIEGCPRCQEGVILFVESAPLNAIAFGRSPEELFARWNGTPPSDADSALSIARPLTFARTLVSRFGSPLHAVFLTLTCIGVIAGTTHGCH